jgi:RpiB/LacA/LacB family sugar-phosphate isomerase
MTIVALGADHGGYRLKEKIRGHLAKKKLNIVDFGAHKLEPGDDYPDYAKKVAKVVSKGSGEIVGILVCRTGIGMSIAANRYNDVRAARVLSVADAKISRKHNDANVLCLPGTMKAALALKVADQFLKERFMGGRHKRRIDKITRF